MSEPLKPGEGSEFHQPLNADGIRTIQRVVESEKDYLKRNPDPQLPKDDNNLRGEQESQRYTQRDMKSFGQWCDNHEGSMDNLFKQ